MSDQPQPSSRDPGRNRALGAMYLAIGVAFLVLGFANQPAFLGAGAAMLAVGVVFLAKARRAP